MKLISWNVNGIRAIFKKDDFTAYIQQEDMDILCLQETRGYSEEIEKKFPHYGKYWNHSVEKKGYSGTAIWVKAGYEPLEITYGMGVKKHDQEGRVICAEYSDYYLICVYTPNSGEGLRRLSYRVTWDRAFLRYLKQLGQNKPLVVCGDLNVAHQEIDLARPNANRFHAGFTKEERTGFDKIVDSGMIDSFREFEKGGDHYTWWSYKSGARKRNVGWRIDYFCVSDELRLRLKSAFIRDDIYGSDHCPVGIQLSK